MVKIKTALWIGGIVGILALIPSGVLFWKLYKAEHQFQELSGQLDIQHKTLTKSLQRAETNQVSQEDIAAFSKKIDLDIDAIKTDLGALGARIEAISSTTAKTTTIHHYHKVSDSSIPSDTNVPICPGTDQPIDTHGYTKTKETRQLRDSNGMRIADVSFEAAEKSPWSDTIYSITYRVNSTVGRTEKGITILHTELLATSEAEPGEIFRIEGIESRILQVPEEVRFRPVDPHILLSIQLGLAVHPTIDLAAAMAIGGTLMTYGEWDFLGLTIGYEPYHNSFFASFIPFAYNIAAHIPVIEDTRIFPWVGVSVGILPNYNVSVGVGIGTRL